MVFAACGGSDDEPSETPSTPDAGGPLQPLGGTGGTPIVVGTGGTGNAGQAGEGGTSPDAPDASADASMPIDASGGSGGVGPVEASAPEPDANPCADGNQSAGEEGVDCGFLTCRRACVAGTTCTSDGDCGSGICVDGHCATPVSGSVASLTLDPSGSPYALSGDVDVTGTFTIDPGVALFGNGHVVRALNVAIEGSATERITLSGVTVDAGGALTTDVGNVSYQYVNVYGGSLMFVPGIARYYTFKMTHCRVRDSEQLYIWYPHGETLISQNIFVDTGGLSIGLNFADDAANATVSMNYFEAMTPATGDAGYIGLWASLGASTLTVEYNTFSDFGDIAVSLRNAAANLVAPNNYWGSTDAIAVEQMIFDKNDLPSLGAVIPTTPLLSAPYPSTPSRDGFPPTLGPDAGATDGGADGGAGADAALLDGDVD